MFYFKCRLLPENFMLTKQKILKKKMNKVIKMFNQKGIDVGEPLEALSKHNLYCYLFMV